MSQTENITTKILKYTLWVCLYLVLLTPLLLSSKFVFPFITLKTIYFRVVVELVVFLYLLLALSNSYYRPRMNKLLWFIIGFGLIVFFTGLIGVDPYKSFWGTIERGEGFLTISHILAFCLVTSQIFKTRQQWYYFFSFSILVSLFVSAYAIAQELNLSWAVSNSNGARFAGTLGNPAYLGAYSLGHFWLAILLFFWRREIWWKIIFSIISLFQLFILYKTETRGAMLGLLVALVLFTLFLIILSGRKKIKIISTTILLAIILFSSSVWLSRESDWVKHTSALNRMATISLHDITSASRLYAWDSSWHGWKDRFLFGYGWENYNVAFNKYFHAEIYRDNGSQIWFDRAHNTVFDVAVAAGLFGLIFYLGIFLLAFVVLFKLVKRNRDNLYLGLSLGAILVAHFVQNIFVFDALATYIMLFSVFGFVSFLASEKKDNTSSRSVVKPLNFYAFTGGIVVLLFMFYNFNLKPAQANVLGIKGLRAFYQGDLKLGVKKFQEAIDMDTYQTPELRQKLAENIIRQNNSRYVSNNDKIKSNFQYAISEVKKNIEDHPYDVQHYLYLLALYNASGSFFPGNLNLVITTAERALTLSPTRPQIYFEMGRAELNRGRINSGIQYFKKAVALNPTTLDSRWNLLTAYIIAGQSDEADVEYQNMLHLGLAENKATLERLIKIYVSAKNYYSTIKLYNKLISLYPANPEYYSRLAQTYLILGNHTSARNLAEDMLVKFPNMTDQINAFIKSIP